MDWSYSVWRQVLSIVALSICMISCTTMRRVEVPFAAEIPAEIKSGDIVAITWQTGVVYRVLVASVTAKALRGIDQTSGKALVFAYVGIIAIRVERFSKGKTTLAIVIPIVAALVIAAMIALGRAFERAGEGQ